jgi:hypothetical protein
MHFVRSTLSREITKLTRNYAGNRLYNCCVGVVMGVFCKSISKTLANLNEFQLRDANNFVDGNYSRSVVTIQLDRSMNHQPIRCEASNPAIDQPLNASLTLTVLCKFSLFILY